VPDLFLEEENAVEVGTARPRRERHRSRAAGLVVLIALVVLMAAALLGAFVFSGDAGRAPDDRPPPSVADDAGG